MRSRGPLTGTTVVELAGIGPGPFACMLLADLGADVIRVDRLPTGAAAVPALTNRGKRSVAIDLKSPAGVDLVLQLVARADVVVEGFRPGVAERLGLGPDACHEVNPALVYGRMTGWGQEGPLAQTAGHDIDYLAITGALSAIGRAGGPPQVPLNLLGDFAGGSLYLVVGVLAALLEARRSGRGDVVDAAIVDGVCHLSSMILEMLSAGMWQDARGANALDTGQPFYDVYRTADDHYMAVGAVEPQFYAELVARLGIAEGLPPREDLGSTEEVRRRFSEAFARRTRAEWTEVFADSDACVAPVLSWREAPDHPHIRQRGCLVAEGGSLRAGPAPRFARSTTQVGDDQPSPGQHTTEVLAELPVKVDDLLRQGVVHQAS